MTKTHIAKSAAIRARLNHPVIDSDGHTVEFEPCVLDYLKQVGGSTMVERYPSRRDGSGYLGWHGLSPEERRDRRATRTPWWGIPSKNTLDRATIMLPKLLYERLDEIGIDLTVLYPTLGFIVPPLLEDEELRRAACRAFNIYHADLFRGYADRIIPVAVIPMHTPPEAIEELEYAVNVLGFKAVVLAGPVLRPIAAVARQYPAGARHAVWLDTFGLDSQYDYDPVWAKCVELKVAPAFHGGSMGWGGRTSISNYIYNHIGNFAAAGEAVCKSLFMRGVTRRFPSLKFAFLEGGVGWACSLYADLIGHWQKRNIKALENYNPANLNRELLVDLFLRYGERMMAGKLDHVGRGSDLLEGNRENPAMLDEWAACWINRAEDIRDLFVPHFYFGCEADDPINTWAFNTKVNPFGARLNVLFSSDIGHWDVPDVTEVVEEAYELVEKGLISEADFRDFVFTNPISLYAGMNPEFFNGTVVENEVSKLLEIESG
jgi:predicted TIM-barrel fold metal-dependent hydrolase